MRERQGCRSSSIEGDMGDVGVRRLCRLRARRVDGCCQAPFLVTADDCLLAGRLGVPSLPVLAFR